MKKSDGSALLVVLVIASGALTSLLYTWFHFSLLYDISHDRIRYQKNFHHALQIFACCQEFACQHFDQLTHQVSDLDQTLTINIEASPLEQSALFSCTIIDSNQLLISIRDNNIVWRALVTRVIHNENVSFNISHVACDSKA